MTQILQLSFFPAFRLVTEGDFFSASDFESADIERKTELSLVFRWNEVSKWNFHTSLVFQRRTNKLSPTPQKTFQHVFTRHSAALWWRQYRWDYAAWQRPN